jgi:hypothetical protein
MCILQAVVWISLIVKQYFEDLGSDRPNSCAISCALLCGRGATAAIMASLLAGTLIVCGNLPVQVL